MQDRDTWKKFLDGITRELWTVCLKADLATAFRETEARINFTTGEITASEESSQIVFTEIELQFAATMLGFGNYLAVLGFSFTDHLLEPDQ